MTGVLTMGTNGCVVAGSSLWLVRPQLFGMPSPDLILSVSNAPSTLDVGVGFPLQVTITNKSVWTAPNTALSVDLGPGLAFADGTSGKQVTTNLGNLNGSTNLTLWVIPTTPGPSTLVLQVTNSLTGTAPEQSRQTFVVTVLPPPVFQFDDTAILEGSYSSATPLIATLSRPAPRNVTASFTVTPLSAKAADFIALSGQFQFFAGDTSARTYIVAGNSIPELDKTALLTFSSTDLLARTNALLTIVNDDVPLVSVTNVSLNEGNTGFTNANFAVTLSAKTPFPVDVQFQVVAGTATPDNDYLPRQGWLHFAPNTVSQAASVPVTGDTVYEPAETASLVLLEATNALIVTASGLPTIKNDDQPPTPVLNLEAADSGLLRFDFPSVSGVTYQLQSRTNLTSDIWRNASAAVPGTGNTASLTLARPSQAAVWYRIMAR